MIDISFHPNAAEAIDRRALEVLGRIEKFDPAVAGKPTFPTELPIAAEFKGNDTIGEINRTTRGPDGIESIEFMSRDDGCYGFKKEALQLVESLIDEILKARWAKDTLSKVFILSSIVQWCRTSFRSEAPPLFSQMLLGRSRLQIKTFSVWAPIADLEVQSRFQFGVATIEPITASFLDNLKKLMIEETPDKQEQVEQVIAKLRETVQGYAAVVSKILAEPKYAGEKGLAIAADVIGLLRFLSAATLRFGILCPTAPLGAQSVPQSNVLLLNEAGRFFDFSSRVAHDHVLSWRIAASDMPLLHQLGLSELSRLTDSESLSEFQERLRTCILTFTKGTTLPELDDRLVYTCSALEGLLIKDGSEPIKQNLGERMAFLIAATGDGRMKIVKNVSEIYNMRSHYIHHRISQLQQAELSVFAENAHAAFFVALRCMHFQTHNEFIGAIDRKKFGG
jgi:hypothetical protein